MATATVQFGELYDEKNRELILLSAKQDGRFRIEVNKQLKNTVGKNRKHVAEEFMKEAVQGIQGKLRKGLSGAKSSVTKAQAKDPKGNVFGPVEMSVTLNGISLGNVRYGTNWSQLSAATIWRKQYHPGSGKFWKDYSGEDGRVGLADLAASMKAPKVSTHTEVVDISTRRATKKDADKIDFTVTLKFGSMGFPFDELVRRPLITGEVDAEHSTPTGNEKENVFYYLEFGVEDSGHLKNVDIPARPWIRSLSALVGERMFDALINR